MVTADSDVLEACARVLGVPTSELAALAARHWRGPQDVDQARVRLRALLATHARNASRSRPRLAAIRMAELVDDALAAGKARTLTEAARIVAEKHHRQPEYVATKAREGRRVLASTRPPKTEPDRDEVRISSRSNP